MGQKEVKDNVVIIGGGLVGCETGLWLAQQGKNVSVVEIAPEILGGPHALPPMNYFMLTDLLKYHKVDIYTNTSVVCSGKDGVTIKNAEGEKVLPADTIIASVGYKENDAIYQSLKDMDIPVYNIGDSSKVHNIMYSIWNAYELARGI